MSVARQIVGKLALNCCTQIICVATGRVVRDVNVGKTLVPWLLPQSLVAVQLAG
jgi:hypothetical protein